MAKRIVSGADPERYIAKTNEYIDAGYEYVWIHQAGPDQEGFFRFFAKEVFLKLDHDCSSCFQRKNF